MNPEWIVAICAGVTLLILWSVTIIGCAVWLMDKMKTLKEEIIADFDTKHAANQMRYDALAVLVTRHETVLNPEFNGAGKHVSRHQ